MSDEVKSYRTQVVGSLLVALLLVALTVAVVTAKIGPGPDAREYREIEDAREERLEERRERLEEQREDSN